MMVKFFNIVLISFCIFTSTLQFRRNPRLFIDDKSLPMGSISERDVTSVLNCGVNPKGGGAYKNFFKMTPKKEFVTPVATCSSVTPFAAFLNRYFHYLPKSRTQNDAFLRASLDYYSFFEAFPFISYKHFQNSIYGTVN